MKKEDEGRHDTQESIILADRLPVLDEEQMRRTQEATPKAWAYRYMSAGIGYVWTHEDLGVSLQIISDDTMRLLTVIDHPYCLLMAASMLATLEHLGLRMDLSQAIAYVSNEVTDSPHRPARRDGKLRSGWSRWKNGEGEGVPPSRDHPRTR